MADKQSTNTGHIPQSSGATKAAPLQGATRQHFRLATGQKVDGKTNPNGVGTPSTKSSISNGTKGW